MMQCVQGHYQDVAKEDGNSDLSGPRPCALDLDAKLHPGRALSLSLEYRGSSQGTEFSGLLGKAPVAIPLSGTAHLSLDLALHLTLKAD